MNLETEKIELIQLLLESNSKEVLREIKMLLNRSEGQEITELQKVELDRRLEKHAKGKMKFYSLDDYENRLNEPQ